MRAKLVWPPHPYKAGFCITDDTDAATFEQVKAVYDFLLVKEFRTTKTVWAFRPMFRCGIPPVPDSALRGITLEDTKYLDYCRQLHDNGFEVCLHGASAGNNTREYTLKALDLLERRFGRCDTFICHAKNADNPYWEDKVTSLPILHRLLKWYSRHRCSGEIELSPFFWGDLCKERINQVRLFRTRSINTLKANPSMPYFDPRKPYVNGWFSATKRRIIDCATPRAREALKRDHGLTVLYQYLFRYADRRTLELDPRFTQAVCDIIGDREILVDTVSHIMQRLRLIQGLFLAHGRDRFWLVNLNQEDVTNVQIAVPNGLLHVSSDYPVNMTEDGLVLPVVPRSRIVCVETSQTLDFEGSQCKKVDGHKRVEWELPFGTLFVNLSESPWEADLSVMVKPHSFVYQGSPPFSCLTTAEELRLVLGQIWIIAREILFKGRHLNVDKFLDDSKEIRLEDHDNW
ncbi:MAG: hypothetical protein JW955_15670 [Sedimentisphaerales bacterium]|nr:hypothetical protein [Sedimentisphaerales bacterium]